MWARTSSRTGRDGAGPRLVVVGALFAASIASGCRKEEPQAEPAPSATPSASPAALTPEQAAAVLARVGDRAITLGEYAEALARMDQFERLRYQTDDRRKELLDEMINVELLAREAERRGLDKQPQTKELVRQLLRDELLKEVRAKLPPLQEIPPGEVNQYYEAHKEEFREPERRRVAHLLVKDEATAKQLVKQVQAGSAEQWGKLVAQSSIDKPKQGEKHTAPPPELAGDLGLVSAPGQARGDNSRVAPGVREAVFKIATVGGVYPEVVRDAAGFHVVRMTGKTDARERTLAEAERTIRVKLVQDKIRKAEEELEEELRKRFPVKIDEAALAKVTVPAANAPEKPDKATR